MRTLVINAPDSQQGREDTRSFIDTFRTGIGKAYGINSKIFREIHSGCRVVLLCKDKRLRAEGELLRLELATHNGVPWVTRNHVQRYDVYVANFTMTMYQPEHLNRMGVGIV